MPNLVKYPGVYVEELNSDQHLITPVSTSVTAFIGRAPIGSTHKPTTISNFGDYQRYFGGLVFDYPMSYAVRDFFANGGSDAIIVRLFEPKDDMGNGIATLAIDSDSQKNLTLVAASPGAWGNGLSFAIDRMGITDETVTQFAQYALSKDDMFNISLSLVDAKGKTVLSERYLNVSVKTKGAAKNYPDRLDRVLDHESALARLLKLPSSAPASDVKVSGGVGGNDGTYLTSLTYLGNQNKKTGIYQLDHVEIFNLLCIPPDRRISEAVPIKKSKI